MKKIISSLLLCLFPLLGFSSTPTQLTLEKFNEISNSIQNINPKVLKLGLLAYENARQEGWDHKGLLTIVDFSLASNKKRMWVIDVEHEKLLFNTLVTHGTGSGFLFAKRFSNKEGSHKSSLGLYDTKATYSGQVGYSLRLKGLDAGFNDHAEERAIVAHGADYANPSYISRYGRLGRSWGCFAMPESIYHEVIDTIKNDSLIFAYYPDGNWLSHSKYLKWD